MARGPRRKVTPGQAAGFLAVQVMMFLIVGVILDAVVGGGVDRANVLYWLILGVVVGTGTLVGHIMGFWNVLPDRTSGRR
jgi:hypothetical protein